MRISAAERAANYAILLLFGVVAVTPVLTILQTALAPETPQDAATGAWPSSWISTDSSSSTTAAVMTSATRFW